MAMDNRPNLTFVGLDIESSGSGTLGRAFLDYQIIQIGVSTGPAPHKTFVSDIGWQDGTYNWEPAALNVNRFTHERIISGPPAVEVDNQLAKWLVGLGLDRPRSLVAVGFNVAGFDLPFVFRYLPETASFLSRRTVDLNAICFLSGGAERWRTWKRSAKVAAEACLLSAGWKTATPHDAGWDAAVALQSFRWFGERIDDNRKQIPKGARD